MNKRDYEAERHHRQTQARAIGQRIRKQRLRAGLSRQQLADLIGFSSRLVSRYELGEQIPPPWRVAAFAQSIGCPVASLLTEELVLAEIRVSDETLERIRREGAPAAREIADRLARSLEPLLLAEATRPPVDLRPHARPKRRRSREEVLAGVAKAQNAAARRRALDAGKGEIS